MWNFPTLAVPVLAGFLGFYLATVGIVVGNSYSKASQRVRNLLLKDEKSRLYLKLVGMAIGYGLALVLLRSLGFSFGYLTLIIYAVSVASGGWAFVQLAFGSFNLFDPALLSKDLLLQLYRSINNFDSGGLLASDIALEHSARDANESLQTLAELIGMIGERKPREHRSLVAVTNLLLGSVQSYAGKKHLLSPTSGWFLRRMTYQRWAEASELETAMALGTSTSLPHKIEPVMDWLERESAEVASAAFKVCIDGNDGDSALQITDSVAATARVMARHSLIDEALSFTRVFHDRCSTIQPSEEVAHVWAENSLSVLIELLLGWRKAVLSWYSEIRQTVETTKWDNRKTNNVKIRLPIRVRHRGQRLLHQIQAEHAISGCRLTPDWYLRSELAIDGLVALREFSTQLSDVLDQYFPDNTDTSNDPRIVAIAGLQALQTLRKCEVVIEALFEAKTSLLSLVKGNSVAEPVEFEDLRQQVLARSSPILQQLGEALPYLRPDNAKSSPDFFGQILSTLIHHSEQAIASGDTDLVIRVFRPVLPSSVTRFEYLASIYRPPTWQPGPRIFNPIIDLLELSGLALVYEALREDQSADPVRATWQDWIHEGGASTVRAKWALDILDTFSSGLPIISLTRSEWKKRLSARVIEAGYATQRYPFRRRPAVDAPRIVKILGVSSGAGTPTVTPRAIFAGEFIAPLAGESERQLRNRSGLRDYYAATNQRHR